MNDPTVMRCVAFLLLYSIAGVGLSQEGYHVVAKDDCGVDGQQRHLVVGQNWTFTEDEVSYSLVPKDSPFRSVSYGSMVHYRYSGLKREALYKLRIGFLTDSNVRYQKLMIDDLPVADTITLVTPEPRLITFDVPKETYADGKINLVLTLIQGRNAAVSQIELLSDDPHLLTVLSVAAKSDFAGRVSGKVSDLNSGRVIGGASLVASVSGFPSVKTSTDDSGAFVLHVPEQWRMSGGEFVRLRISHGAAQEVEKLTLFELFPETNPLTVTPHSVHGVEHCRVSLNGEWQFTMTPGGSFWLEDTSVAGWKSIRVPGECRMQGFPIAHDREYAYRRTLDIPADFKRKRIVIRFNGVYSHARVWVNGRYVRSHHGGFTAWECDITRFVQPGKPAYMVVGFTDRVDDPSFGSGYARHPIGGILRNVELLALPDTHIRKCYLTTRFDVEYRNAVLRVEVALSRPRGASLELTLNDPAGKGVRIAPASLKFAGNTSAAAVDIPVTAPVHWDSEHPRLYTLEARLMAKGRTEEIIRQRFGFRQIDVKGTQLFVNGQPVKLRGVCRHDIHPLLGRSTTSAQDREDVLLAKEANVNFIRTSHYPPSREFLEYCDEYGVYVEEETAVCFVGTFREGVYKAAGSTQNDGNFTERYLSQLAEMIDRDRNHPCVIIWSIGNENTYGTNFQREFDYVKKADRSRPVMFSFPRTVPQGTYCYDIYSDHYPPYDRCLRLSTTEGAAAYPVLGDEWMHVACYCVQDLKEDPNIRNAWGESIKRAWEYNFDSEQSIGGAIWGMIDEVFLLPDTCTGYGQWGIVDVWRRKKPEFWHTRKAYSPVGLQTTRVADYVTGEDLLLPLHNRFDHTNMAEMRILCGSGAASDTIHSPDIAPHARGELRIPAALIEGDRVHVRFVDGDQRLIDEEVIAFSSQAAPDKRPVKRLRVDETPDKLIASGEEFSVTFSKASGLIEAGTFAGARIIDDGPYIRLVVPGRPLSWDVDTLADVTGTEWKLDTMSCQTSNERLALALQGHAGRYAAKFNLSVTGDGEIVTSYEIEKPPENCREVGIRFLVTPAMDKLSWNRHALWSTYPEDHIGRSVGEASKFASIATHELYRQMPDWPWSGDTKDFYLFRNEGGTQPAGLPVPHDFRGLKENIFQYALWNQQTGVGLRVESEGTLGARTAVQPDGSLHLFVDNEWTYANLNWGNYERPVEPHSPYKGTVRVRFCRAR
jgi:beta-galactosidase